MEQIEIRPHPIIKCEIMENVILRAEKDEENSTMVLETNQGQEWVSCAECRLGELACNYLKSKWGVDPCLYRRGVRLGRRLEPDPRDVINIVQRNISIYLNTLDEEGPFIKAELEMFRRVLKLETEELEHAKSLMYEKGKT
jgi:serine protease inhibitor ecotin